MSDQPTIEPVQPRKTKPGRQKVEYGVVLDGQDSLDTYSTYDEAAEAFRQHGGQTLVQIVTIIEAHDLPVPLTAEELRPG
jgi:hypothetical protein